MDSLAEKIAATGREALADWVKPDYQPVPIPEPIDLGPDADPDRITATEMTHLRDWVMQPSDTPGIQRLKRAVGKLIHHATR